MGSTSLIPSGEIRRDERKRTADDVPKFTGRCRNQGKVVASGMSLGGALEPGPSGTRLGGGVNPDQALLRNAETCRPDVKGEAQAGGPRESQSTDAGHRGGAVHSRDEGPVMGLDRRGCGILLRQAANR
jgi:hypothetical protein